MALTNKFGGLLNESPSAFQQNLETGEMVQNPFTKGNPYVGGEVSWLNGKTYRRYKMLPADNGTDNKYQFADSLVNSGAYFDKDQDFFSREYFVPEENNAQIVQPVDLNPKVSKGLGALAPLAMGALALTGFPGVLATGFGGGTIGAIGSGAVMGALGSGLGGGDPFKGALMGGVGGGVSSGVSSALSGSGLPSSVTSALSGAASGGARAAVSGGNIGQGIIGGGLSGFGGAAGRDLAQYSGVTNPIGMGLIGQIPGLLSGFAQQPRQRKMPVRTPVLPPGAPPGARLIRKS